MRLSERHMLWPMRSAQDRTKPVSVEMPQSGNIALSTSHTQAIPLTKSVPLYHMLGNDCDVNNFGRVSETVMFIRLTQPGIN